MKPSSISLPHQSCLVDLQKAHLISIPLSYVTMALIMTEISLSTKIAHVSQYGLRESLSR